jgi:hypothetical protein
MSIPRSSGWWWARLLCPARSAWRRSARPGAVAGQALGAFGAPGDGGDAPAGVRVAMPRRWRVKALRSDGQVVPSSAAAALTPLTRSARAKSRSASARSARKRLGCQPYQQLGMQGPTAAAGSVQPAFGARELTRTRLFHRSGRPCRVTCLGQCPVNVQDRPPISASRACWVRRAMIVLPLPS